MSKTIKFTYHYQKVIDYEGEINISVDEFNEAKNLAEYNPEYPEDGKCLVETDWSEMKGISANCDICSFEFSDPKEVNFIDDCPHLHQVCNDCFKEIEEEQNQ